MKGIFITFEGLDGSGKTTQINKLNEYLNSKGYEVVFTREPGGTPLGDRIRDLLLDAANKGMSFKTEVLLFEASRAELVSKIIKPALDSGKIVLCDRFFDSTIVYQGIARGLGIDQVYEMSLWAASGIEPDLTFLLSLDVGSSEDRLSLKKGPKDRIEYEKNSFKQKVREGYLKVAEKFPDRFVLIDASINKNKIFIQVKKIVDRLLKKKGILLQD